MKKFLIRCLYLAVASSLIISHTSCINKFLNPTTVVSKDETLAGVSATLTNTPVPIEATPTKESPYFAVDLGFSKEEIVNKGFLISINNYIKKDNYEKYPYQYQAWFDNGKISVTYYNQAYVAEARGGKSLMEFGGASERYGFAKGSLELKIFDAVMESGINTRVYMGQEYLDPELHNVKATIAYVVTDGDRHYYYMIGTDGIAVYVDNGNVSIYSGSKIPSFLPDEVKEKFKEGYTRVENNDGEVEAFGNINEAGQSGL